jgi:alanyl-tRNA synthetase
VAANAARVLEELAREEGAFTATLERGTKILEEVLGRAAAGNRTVGGPDAFLLYDTFGFPLELTQEVAEARGIQARRRPARRAALPLHAHQPCVCVRGRGAQLLSPHPVRLLTRPRDARTRRRRRAQVDAAGFQAEMEAQRQRSKEGREEIDLTAQASLGSLASSIGPTRFVGYDSLAGAARVVALVAGGRSVERAEAGASRSPAGPLPPSSRRNTPPPLPARSLPPSRWRTRSPTSAVLFSRALMSPLHLCTRSRARRRGGGGRPGLDALLR